MGFCVNRNDISVDRFDYGVDVVWNLTDTDGNPYDVTGMEIQIIVKQNKYTPDSKSIYNQTIVGNGSTITMPLDQELTGNNPGAYYYALRLIENGNFVDTFIQAQFIIIQNTFSEGANG